MSPAGNLLAGKVGAVRAHLQRRAALAVALWAGAALGVALAAAWLLAGPGGWRQGSAAPLVLDLVALAAAGAVVLGTRVALGRRLAEAPLAFAMEAAAGLRPGVVRGALELGRAVPGGVSPALVEHAAVQAAEALAAPPAALAGSLGAMVGRWLRRGAAAAAGVAVVLTLLAASAPTRAARAWGGLSSPLGVLARPVLPPLSVTPGSAEVPRGADVVVRVEAPGRAVAELAWQAVGDVPRVDTLELEEGAGMRVFRALSSPVEYRARTADGAFTETFRLVPVDPLFIGEWSVQVVYPPHTGLPPEEHRGSVGALRLPEGTRLVVEGRASRPLSRAALLASDGTPALELTVAGSRFEGAWVPERSGVFPWRVEDVAGSGAETLPEPLEIRLVPDSTPEVGIPLPGRDTVLTLSLKQPLVLQARDDHGLRRLELVAYRVTAAGSSEEPRVQGLELQGTRAALARPLLDLSGWKLLPGDQVRYFARATDNAPHPGTGRSPEYALRMPDASELRREAGELLGAAAARLDELAAEAQRRAEETRDLQREAAAARPQEPGRPDSPDSGARMGFKEQEELRKALEGQQDLTAEVEALRAELAALQQAMEDAGQADPDLRRDLEELRRLMEQIAGEAEQDRLDELARGLQGQDPREADRSLRDLGREQDGLRERLERSLERFRRAALEQELRATRADAEELADRERALAAAMKEGDRPELRAAQQAALEDEARDLLARMDSLQGSLGGRGEREAARGAARAREEAVLARERMAEAREEAKRGQGARAGEKAGEAADRMRSAAEELDRAQSRMAQQLAQSALEALRRAADDALALARRQDRLRKGMGDAPPEALVEMRGDQASLLQGARNLAGSLHGSAEGILASNPAMAAQLGRAMESLQRTLQSLESRRSPSPRAAAEEAVDDLNQLALMALAGAERMGSPQGQGERGEDAAEQLEDLAQQQGEMVERASRLTPLQLGAQALREQLERIATEQQSVADHLEELSRQERAEEETLGDLGELAGEAEALAEALARGRLTPETLERQERLFHRLLDAGRSLEREDEDVSDERESRTPGAFERGEVQPLGSERLGALRYGLPGPEELRRLPPAVRQLVLRYFEQLNRGGGGGP